MPKIKTNRVNYPEGWELIEPTIHELDAKMREAENDSHDGKRKCEALWPIFRISHQRSRYIYDLFYRRKEISKELYEFCLDQGYADHNLIAKWKKGWLGCNANMQSNVEAQGGKVLPAQREGAQLLLSSLQKRSSKQLLHRKELTIG